MSFDVARVRGLYPTLGAGLAHLDGTYGALQPETVIRAIITALRWSPSQPGSTSPRSRRSAASVADARRAVADLVGTTPDGVVLGGNVSVLLHRFAWRLSRQWQLGDEIVVSRLDHDANARPWIASAKAAGAVVQWAEVDLETGGLPDWQYEKLINTHTRLVTLPLANPTTGHVPEVRHIATMAHAMGAVVVVDAGAALAHVPVDMRELGADLLALCGSTFGGPTVGAVAARPGFLGEIDENAHEHGPEWYEVGALPVELLDGLTAAVDHLADLDEQATGTRRERLLDSLDAAGSYQRRVFVGLEARLRAIPGVTVIGSGTEPVPVLGLAVSGRSPAQVGEFLLSRGVSVWTGPSGMSELMHALGTDEMGGIAHVGVMPHTTADELDQLVQGISELARA
jgi:cysteine desulfurase family protein (TIGR01976 family)